MIERGAGELDAQELVSRLVEIPACAARFWYPSREYDGPACAWLAPPAAPAATSHFSRQRGHVLRATWVRSGEEEEYAGKDARRLARHGPVAEAFGVQGVAAARHSEAEDEPLLGPSLEVFVCSRASQFTRFGRRGLREGRDMVRWSR